MMREILGWTVPLKTENHRPDSWVCKPIGLNPNMLWKSNAAARSRIIQQQHDGVQFFPRSVIGSQWHYEVVQAISSCFSRNDDQLVLEAIRLGVLKTVVPTTLKQNGNKTLIDWNHFTNENNRTWPFIWSMDTKSKEITQKSHLKQQSVIFLIHESLEKPVLNTVTFHYLYSQESL